MPPNPEPSIVCAENIAIFFLLHSIPVPPSRNSTDYLLAHQRHYTLPINTERKLARTLAFLAHSKNNTDHIPALYLEKEPDLETLKVIITVNKTNYYNSKGLILCIKQGFEIIFAVLARVLTGIEKEILAKIVYICSPRILYWLQLLSSGRNPLKHIIGKVSRYYKTTRFFYCTAKKYQLVQKIRTVSVHLPKEAYDTRLFNRYTPDLRSKIIERSPKNNHQKLLKKIPAGLNLTQQGAINQDSRQAFANTAESDFSIPE
ncbi:hypothetical protein BDW59DRAFT_169255 [Aspergillus cavernicola]|uniref:Uncharacterized protein n=1 Tax=Aspergillus cavernicola TaxID=176166 RepID=A0ABR4IYZ7_9EURO